MKDDFSGKREKAYASLSLETGHPVNENITTYDFCFSSSPSTSPLIFRFKKKRKQKKKKKSALYTYTCTHIVGFSIPSRSVILLSLLSCSLPRKSLSLHSCLTITYALDRAEHTRIHHHLYHQQQAHWADPDNDRRKTKRVGNIFGDQKG